MSALLRFSPSIVLALAGAGVELGGYENPWLGNALLVSAAVLAIAAAASLWIQQYNELRAARAVLQRESPQEIAQLQERLQKLADERDEAKAERDALREEKRQNLQERRRQRIEEWRSVIRNFDFENEKFGATDTYSQMKPHLRGQAAQIFEAARTVHLVNEARGDSLHRRELLDEAARIEKEWGLI